MIVDAKLKVNDHCQVLIGKTWHNAVVTDVWHWNHSSGNSYPAYAVVFRDGSKLSCGNNSIRKGTCHA